MKFESCEYRLLSSSWNCRRLILNSFCAKKKKKRKIQDFWISGQFHFLEIVVNWISPRILSMTVKSQYRILVFVFDIAVKSGLPVLGHNSCGSISRNISGFYAHKIKVEVSVCSCFTTYIQLRVSKHSLISTLSLDSLFWAETVLFRGLSFFTNWEEIELRNELMRLSDSL